MMNSPDETRASVSALALRLESTLAFDILKREKLEAALELARLVADETGLCCERLGQFTWACYRKLEGEQ